MTVGHQLFAVVITGYILIGIQLEEHDLIQQFGDQYRRYRERAAEASRRVSESPPAVSGAVSVHETNMGHMAQMLPFAGL